ncbi:hypothetical protein [Desertibacillus haloalkaliphilus]|uniref:hypothetical protein n=1 Tax=Desertibacillus haloalkaliphilus TaxID=1328930 RepID=UPI001C25F3A6|nr:hypothetical protein [Desertibacillus haloalkaliphilus]MBU8906688.1 hypothetical protein [Desertibacillus haloalkaliphilus]
MNKKSIGQEMVIRQCLFLLPTIEFSYPLMDYGKYKLFTEAMLRIFVAAQLDGWASYAFRPFSKTKKPPKYVFGGDGGTCYSKLSQWH